MKAEDVTATLDLALKASGLDQAKAIHRPRLLSSDQPPILRITGRCLPDRDTIGGSRADRDYRMSRHDNAALTLVAPPRIADRRPFLATRPGFRSHYEIRLTAFYLSPKRCRHRRHRPRRRSPGDCMLSSLALRSFIFHPNQWLVLKAVRQAPARPAYTRRPRCTADIFCNLAWWRETYFRGLLVRPFRA
jgi:hypothetical protein